MVSRPISVDQSSRASYCPPYLATRLMASYRALFRPQQMAERTTDPAAMMIASQATRFDAREALMSSSNFLTSKARRKCWSSGLPGLPISSSLQTKSEFERSARLIVITLRIVSFDNGSLFDICVLTPVIPVSSLSLAIRPSLFDPSFIAVEAVSLDCFTSKRRNVP